MNKRCEDCGLNASICRCVESRHTDEIEMHMDAIIGIQQHLNDIKRDIILLNERIDTLAKAICDNK